MYLAKVYVTLKPTVNDPQGFTILGALHSLGFSAAKDVRAGKYLEIHIEEETKAGAEGQVKEMCRKLLANPVIEDFSIEIVDIDG